MGCCVLKLLDGGCGRHVGEGLQHRLHSAAGKALHVDRGQVGQVAHLGQLRQGLVLLAPAARRQAPCSCDGCPKRIDATQETSV